MTSPASLFCNRQQNPRVTILLALLSPSETTQLAASLRHLLPEVRTRTASHCDEVRSILAKARVDLLICRCPRTDGPDGNLPNAQSRQRRCLRGTCRRTPSQRPPDDGHLVAYRPRCRPRQTRPIHRRPTLSHQGRHPARPRRQHRGLLILTATRPERPSAASLGSMLRIQS